MNCELARTTVHGYFDGELDAVRSAEFERHLESCPACQSALENIEALHVSFQQSSLYENASPELRERIRGRLGQQGSGRVSSASSRRWFLVPAFGVLAAVAAIVTIMFFVLQLRGQSQITAELIDAHVRSLQPGHLTDVQSTDQHTVKPWFDGKLDFIPPVSDYAEQGFPLVGGRLDVIDGHNVAALVFARRKHFVNLFIWPARGSERLAENSGSRQGYNWMIWRSGDMQFCLVSDAAAADLREIKNLMHR